jgi:hypothetical protein
MIQDAVLPWGGTTRLCRCDAQADRRRLVMIKRDHLPPVAPVERHAQGAAFIAVSRS